MQRLSPQQLADWLAAPADRQPLLLDVREEWEFDTVHLPGSVLMPLADLVHEADSLPLDRPIVVICHHGVRSQMACRLLAHHGLSALYDLQGGIDAWSREIDPTMPRY